MNTGGLRNPGRRRQNAAHDKNESHHFHKILLFFIRHAPTVGGFAPCNRRAGAIVLIEKTTYKETSMKKIHVHCSCHSVQQFLCASHARRYQRRFLAGDAREHQGPACCRRVAERLFSEGCLNCRPGAIVLKHTTTSKQTSMNTSMSIVVAILFSSFYALPTRADTSGALLETQREHQGPARCRRAADVDARGQ